MQLNEALDAIGVRPNPQITPQSPATGRPVIVRSRDAGVLFGDYAGHDGATVYLTNARQMWRWRAAKGGTLIDCATVGVKAEGCKFSPASATVTVFNACALIDCTDDAAASMRGVGDGTWK